LPLKIINIIFILPGEYDEKKYLEF